MRNSAEPPHSYAKEPGALQPAVPPLKMADGRFT
jgi:hypothetical protein